MYHQSLIHCSLKAIFIATFAGLLLAGCQKAEEPSHVRIQLPHADPQFLKSTSTVGAMSGGWGLSSPTSMGEITCYALLVGGPTEALKQSKCTTQEGTAVAQFGLLFGPYAAGSVIDVEVPSGPKRDLFLVGLRAETLAACSQFQFHSPQRDLFSAPRIVSKQTVDLTPGVVEVVMRVDVPSGTSFEICSSPKQVSPSPSPSPSPTPTPPPAGPSVSIDSPVNGTWVGNSITVTGTCSEEGQGVEFDDPGNTTVSCVSGSYSQVVDLTSLAEGAFTLCADHIDAQGNPAPQSCVTYNKDVSIPTMSGPINFSTPTNLTTETPEFFWPAASDPGGGISHYLIDIGTTMGANDILEGFDAGLTLSKTVTGLSLSENAYYVSIRAVDLAGNISAQYAEPIPFVIDASAPVPILSSSAADPVNGSFSVEVDFGERIDGGLSASAITVVNGNLIIVNEMDASIGLYSIEVDPIGSPVSVSISANEVFDLAGNGNNLSNTITRNYTAPMLDISDISYLESAGTASVTVTLSAALGVDVSFDYATSDGTATSALDYSSTSGTLTITAGNTTASIPIPLLDDAIFEGDETFQVSLSNPVNAVLGIATATVTITEDDSQPETGVWSNIAMVGSPPTPADRSDHTAVWTGSEMIIWGGRVDATRTNTGSMYMPDQDLWDPVATPAIAARAGHTAVWTGARMIVWGGTNGSTHYQDGAVYNPGTNAWEPLGETGLTSQQRANHSAIWTGHQMIIWGGDVSGTYKNTGFMYSLEDDSWTAVTTSLAPTARSGHAAVWTGSKMLIWGGYNGGGPIGDGKMYDPSTDTWVSISSTNAPSARRDFAYAWTGSKLIIWGGYNGSSRLNDGAMYDPIENSWQAISSDILAPSARNFVRGLWTGQYFLVWGGIGGGGAEGTGGIYDPVTDSWMSTSTISSPSARYGHSFIWTGTHAIAYGGGPSPASPVVDHMMFRPDFNPERVRQIASGYSHNCALSEMGQVKCWGGNTNGALGVGDTSARGDQANEMDIYLSLVGLPTASTALSIDAGTFFTCVLLDNRNVACWGKNDMLQLGIDTSLQSIGDGAGEMGDNLGLVPLSTRVRQIAVGQQMACALLDNANVECWGRNEYGEIGDPTVALAANALPTVVRNVDDTGPLQNVVEIEVGSNHACARDDLGYLYCWGRNNYGQLGIGTTSDSNLPTLVNASEPIVQKLALGASTSCALFHQELRCWGRNDYGQVGVGDVTVKTSPMSVLSNVLKIGMGDNHTCATHKDGLTDQLFCFGLNTQGAIGIDSTTNALLPEVVLDVGEDVEQVTAGSNFTCARYRGGDLRCWGANTSGQLGQGSTTSKGTSAGSMNTLVGFPIPLGF